MRLVFSCMFKRVSRTKNTQLSAAVTVVYLPVQELKNYTAAICSADVSSQTSARRFQKLPL